MPKQHPIRLAHALQLAGGAARTPVVKSAALPCAHRERLTEGGYLQKIYRSWYLLSRPVEQPGDNPAWYAAFWGFLLVYLEQCFDPDYCLCGASSLDLASLPRLASPYAGRIEALFRTLRKPVLEMFQDRPPLSTKPFCFRRIGR